MRERRIANWLNLIGLITGIGFSLFVGVFSVKYVAFFVGALSLSYLLYRIGVFSAGDAKFFLVVCSFFPIFSNYSLLSFISLFINSVLAFVPISVFWFRKEIDVIQVAKKSFSKSIFSTAIALIASITGNWVLAYSLALALGFIARIPLIVSLALGLACLLFNAFFFASTSLAFFALFFSLEAALIIYSKRKELFRKRISSKKAFEGMIVNWRKPSGLSKQEVKELKASRVKYLVCMKALPFAPAVLIGFLLSLIWVLA